MAAINFESWLSEKLKTINVDPEIFGSYIQSILEGDESETEKYEALQGIFDEEIGNDELINEVLLQWSKLSNLNVNKKESAGGDLDAKLSRIMEEQAKSVVCESAQLTSEEKRLRQVILNQYGQISDGEDDAYQDDDPGGVENGAAFGSYSLMSRNTNGETVMNAEREKREKSKGDHEKKKAQDKLNREKQKQQQQDRKDKEKKRTQKSERKR